MDSTQKRRPIRPFRIVAASLVAAGLVAPTALADPPTGHDPSSGYTVIPYLSQGQGTVERPTPPSATGNYSEIPDGYSPRIELPPAASTASAGSSVDWADVGIGAGAMAAFAALLGGALALGTRGTVRSAQS